MTKQVVCVSLGSSSRDYQFSARLFGEEFHVRRAGANGDAERARGLVSEFDDSAAVISLDGLPLQLRIGGRVYHHRLGQAIAHAAQNTPVVDGANLKATLERWGIAHVARQHPDLFRHRRVLFLSGLDHYGLAQVLGSYTEHLVFADPIIHHGLPFVLRSLAQLDRYAGLALPGLCRSSRWAGEPSTSEERDRRTRELLKHLKKADVVVGDSLHILRLAPAGLGGKVVVADDLLAGEVDKLRDAGVESLITFSPPLDDAVPYVGSAVLEAILANLAEGPVETLTEDDYLDLVERCGLEPHVSVLNEPQNVARFAFVIHPLSAKQIFNHPRLKFLRFLPHRLVEWVMAQIRPLYVSRITGIRSAATGEAVEGYLISLGATPRELMRRRPGFTYRRLIVASRMAQQRGARIMGLGAFTKVVGDAGITVAFKSDIAITSGNSLTVAATLEAAKQAVLKMGGRVDKGRAVVIGATGSIGAVCSRLLAQAIQDVVLVAPRPEKLIPLKRTIEEETPGARVTIATRAGPHLGEADLVVTTTTAIGEKVIDVRRLKPGCVVCDVARPPDVQEADARLRPDVLVIESGEILLPGEPDFGFNIGLPPGVAYACLAEAAVLAMEGRFETFTLGRNIEMDKVKEIYRLFKKHGLQLEGLRSFGRYVTDEEIARKRELADALRRDPGKLEALLAEDGGSLLAQTAQRRGLGPIGAVGAVAASTAALVVGWLWSRRRKAG